MKQLVVALFTVSIAMNANASEVKLNYTAKEIKLNCKEAIRSLFQKAKLVTDDKNTPTFQNTVIPIENAFADLLYTVQPMTMLSNISPVEAVRDAADACEGKLAEEILNLMSDENLFKRFEAVKNSPEAKTLDKVDFKLLDDHYKSFIQTGAGISDQQLRKQARTYMKKIAKVNEIQFAKNLRDDQRTVVMTQQELDGMPDTWIKKLKKDKNGNYLVTTNYPHYVPFMENAKNEIARKRLYKEYLSRGGKENVNFLKDTLTKRRQIANLMGFQSYGERVLQLDGKMASSPAEVLSFLQNLQTRLKPYLDKDIADMKALKCEDLKCSDPNNVSLNPWDIFYYQKKMDKKVAETLDDEKVMEYFPLDHVTAAMFDIYQTLLGIQFIEQEAKNLWFEGVKKYLVIDKSTKEEMGTFYLDMFPREGKYTHAAVMGIIPSRELSKGIYQKRLAVMMCNFTPPAEDGSKPSLLSHDEVETYFHEFGHVMDNLLTKTKYASHDGTPRDWVEAPSQMLENWVWSEEGLNKLSGHYQTGEKLPEEMLNELIKIKFVSNGWKNTVQVFYSTMDMKLHDRNIIEDPVQEWFATYKNIFGIDLLPGTTPPGTFGHLMGGYAVGYYGYLWSNQFASDMFTIFEEYGIFNPEIGMRYRKEILEPSGSRLVSDSLRKFLGRETNPEAFYKELGLEAN